MQQHEQQESSSVSSSASTSSKHACSPGLVGNTARAAASGSAHLAARCAGNAPVLSFIHKQQQQHFPQTEETSLTPPDAPMVRGAWRVVFILSPKLHITCDGQLASAIPLPLPAARTSLGDRDGDPSDWGDVGCSRRRRSAAHRRCRLRAHQLGRPCCNTTTTASHVP